MRVFQSIIYVVIAFLLFSCSTGKQGHVTVRDASNIEAIPKKGFHRVVANETLYSIAWRYGLDYRAVAQRNHLSAPYAIYPGQNIYLRGPSAKIKSNVTPASSSSSTHSISPKKRIAKQSVEREPVSAVAMWRWPAQGTVIAGFSEMNKGINIGGRSGDGVYATAAGKVVYSGDGLRRYGNLIIIKHNSTYLTAYAHNKVNYVKPGDWVSAGQKIAQMGNTGTTRVMLHFEIRRNGLPVNPLVYLAR